MPVIGNSTYTERSDMNSPCTVNSFFGKNQNNQVSFISQINYSKKWDFSFKKHHIIILIPWKIKIF